MKGVKVGDVVSIYFVFSEPESWVEVIKVPASTGDTWTVQRLEDNTIVEVQMFEKMVRHEPIRR